LTLIRFLHGKKDGMDKLVVAFFTEHPVVANTISKNYLRNKISEIADKQKHTDGYGTLRWIVKPEYSVLVNKTEDKVTVCG
jgi:hypothetical protein